MPYRCSLCKQTGHNRRTCKERQSTVVTNPSNEAETCPICMEILGKTNICTTKCEHQFCLKCMLKHTATKDNCPLCRTSVDGADTRTNIPGTINGGTNHFCAFSLIAGWTIHIALDTPANSANVIWERSPNAPPLPSSSQLIDRGPAMRMVVSNNTYYTSSESEEES